MLAEVAIVMCNLCVSLVNSLCAVFPVFVFEEKDIRVTFASMATSASIATFDSIA